MCLRDIAAIAVVIGVICLVHSIGTSVCRHPSDEGMVAGAKAFFHCLPHR